MHLIQTQIGIQAPEDKESFGKQEYCNSLQIHLFHIQMLVHKVPDQSPITLELQHMAFS